MYIVLVQVFCHSRETYTRAGGVEGIHSYRHSRGTCARVGGVAGIQKNTKGLRCVDKREPDVRMNKTWII
jgi:hypothetical protein